MFPDSRVNFRLLEANESLNDADLVIPSSSVEEVNNRCVKALYGYFIENITVFPVVYNYVRNVGAKFGLQRVMMNSKGSWRLFFRMVHG
ncbi:hypothetical protein Tco_0830839 [Tanacetum coccineum]